MDSDCIEFDYEGFLEKYSNQDETRSMTEEQRHQVDQTFTDVFENHKSILKALNAKRRLKAKSRALVAKQLNVQTCYNAMLKTPLDQLRKLYQDISLIRDEASQSILLDYMEQLNAEYESLDSEFDDKTLRARITLLKEAVQPVVKDVEKYENILSFARKAASKSEPLPEVNDTEVLAPLSESIILETAENFGPKRDFEYMNIKLSDTLRNIDALKKNLADLETQMQ